MAAAGQEFQFYLSKAWETNKRFAGKHPAIVGDRVVATGGSPIELWKRARKAHPRSRPLLAYVLKVATLVCEWLNSLLPSLRGKKFSMSLTGFLDLEELHEPSRDLSGAFGRS